MRLTLNITALLLTSTFSEHTASQEVADDEIIISGARSDRVFQRRGGTSTSIRPSEETRFDVGSHFKLDPSLRGIDTGRSTNGGFSVPLFRGHDVRSTNVFIDDVLLQDPFTGFPLVEDIDLRSFGELHIHKGLAPWNIPITQPGGVIQFITRPPAFGRSTKIGSALSTENSQSAWVEENRKTNASSIKGYFRRRTSAGKYEFYDDNQTIRNPDDDRVRKRENNQSNSSLSSFAGERRFDHAGIKSLLWYQTSELGIPAKGSFDDGSARLKNHTGVGSAHANFKLSDEFSLRISSQYTRLQKQFRDPQRNIGLTSGQESTASTTRNAISLTKHGDIFSFLSDLSYSSALVGRNDALRDSSSAIKREITSVYVGSEVKILPNLLLEMKGDRLIAPERPSSNIGATVYVASDFVNMWVQAAKHKRPPTLLEVHGNGVEIESAANLENEHGDFMEIGSRTYTNIGPWTGEWSLTYWQDYLRDRLRIKPISATLWRAGNVDKESYRGAEIRNRWENHTIEIELAGAYTDAKQSNSLRIAKVPLWQSVVAGAWAFVPDWKIRLSQRFQGRYFYDDLETLEVSETSFQDITLDRYRPNSPWTLGISCTNVSNNLSTRFSDVSTNQGRGRIAKESINGDPLPGRQFAISFKTLLP